MSLYSMSLSSANSRARVCSTPISDKFSNVLKMETRMSATAVDKHMNEAVMAALGLVDNRLNDIDQKVRRLCVRACVYVFCFM